MGQRYLTHKLFFPYDDNQSFTYRSFQRWVALSPNPPSMIDEEKEEATTHRVSHPSLCKCEYRSQLANPPTGLDYTPFWRCYIPLSVIPNKRYHFFVVLEVLIFKKPSGQFFGLIVMSH
jgi:hypothetical protein